MTMNESVTSRHVEEARSRVIAAQVKLDGSWSQHRGLNGQLNRLEKQVRNKTFDCTRAGSMVKAQIEVDLVKLNEQRRNLNDQIASCNGRIAAAETELNEARDTHKSLQNALGNAVIELVKMLLRCADQARLDRKKELKARDLEREKATRAARKAAHKERERAAKEAVRQKKAAQAASLEAARQQRAAQIAAQEKANKGKADRKHRHA